ncbi:AAA family ATPase [Verminephrobacter eiseniae]|uniref:AAA family ATPase n=1 Tax=Verminephrobacter eiseniae TaxID=364317 RepID=UPI002237142C|nr:AAA family ATPase [Verminephrobacter eiseniae]MCW5235645.1 ATP/GTP-binding protein [Verminephrobacter eiseniae]
MRFGITGTYSSGKTLTSLVVSHLLALPRTEARTMREILPEAAPGKALEEVTSAQLIQMIVTRHTERVLHEHLKSPDFVSDGCSLQEWIYGSVRVKYGVNPNQSINMAQSESVAKTDELAYFEQIMFELGNLFKRHVKQSFDLLAHLPNELPLAKDGHRPVNEKFRSASDDLLKETFDELGIKYVIVGGSMEKRVERIVDIVGRKPVISVSEAIVRAQDEYNNLVL